MIASCDKVLKKVSVTMVIYTILVGKIYSMAIEVKFWDLLSLQTRTARKNFTYKKLHTYISGKKIYQKIIIPKAANGAAKIKTHIAGAAKKRCGSATLIERKPWTKMN